MSHQTRSPVLITTDEHELIECFRWLSPDAARAIILLITASMGNTYTDHPDAAQENRLRLVSK